MADFPWSERTEKAAEAIARGELPDSEIAATAGVSRQTLWNWRKHPEFSARVDSLIEDFRATIRRRAIGWVERRVERLNRDWLRLQQVADERGRSPEMASVPGGTTGLLVRGVKVVGKGDETLVVDLYEVDTALLSELRQIEKQAAIELGQWTEKHEVSGLGEAHDLMAQYADPDDQRRIPGEDAGVVPGAEQPA